jgi:ketosteroid isomerase-like protein
MTHDRTGVFQMKRFLFAGIVMVLAAAPLRAQTSLAVERELIKRESDWSTAWVKKDAAFLKQLYAEEYLATDEFGATFTRAQDLANAMSPEGTLVSFVLSNLKVHVYGDAAVVTGTNTTKATFKGKDTSGVVRFTDVFVKRNGRWQAVASQGTRVVKK